MKLNEFLNLCSFGTEVYMVFKGTIYNVEESKKIKAKLNSHVKTCEICKRILRMRNWILIKTMAVILWKEKELPIQPLKHISLQTLEKIASYCSKGGCPFSNHCNRGCVMNPKIIRAHEMFLLQHVQEGIMKRMKI